MHCFGCSRVGKRICASSAFAVSLMAFLQSPQATAAGISYAAHVVSMSRGQGAVFARMDGRNSDWIARVAFAHGRGRADFVSGQSVLRAGDHLLFDSADAVVVHDSTKTYTIISRNYLARLQQPGLSVVVRNVKSTLDTLGTAPLGARSTTRIRLSQTYETALVLAEEVTDAASDLPRIETDSKVEYWLTHIDGLPADAVSPRTDLPALAPGRVLAEHAIRQGAAALLPRNSIALMIVANTRTSMTTDGSALTTVDTTTVSDVRPTDVDLSRLVIPPGFTEIGPPGLRPRAAGAPDPAAKWRDIP